MNLRSQPLSKNEPFPALNDLIVDAIQDIKGKRIIKLDLRELDDSVSDFFIICEGESNTQIKALAENIHKRVKDELDVRPSHIEGQGGGKWILVDYFSTVVHIFYPETRTFYDLEDLWSDALVTQYESL